MQVYIKNQQRLIRVNQKRTVNLLKRALHLLCLEKAEVSILFVNDRRMRILNSLYRGVDRTTDVLSFPQHSPKEQKRRRSEGLNSGTSELLLGDIVINLHKAKRQAAEYCITFNEELKKLLIHGLLHLIGYDHERGGYEEEKMMRKERELLSEIPYI